MVSIDLTAIDGTSPYTYNWSNGETTEDISNLSTGTYTVTITDANGCTVSVSVFIAQPTAALNATAGVSQNVNCFGGSNGSIDLTATDGTAPYTFSLEQRRQPPKTSAAFHQEPIRLP